MPALASEQHRGTVADTHGVTPGTAPGEPPGPVGPTRGHGGAMGKRVLGHLLPRKGRRDLAGRMDADGPSGHSSSHATDAMGGYQPTPAGTDAMGGNQPTPAGTDAVGGNQPTPAGTDPMGGYQPTPAGTDAMGGYEPMPPGTDVMGRSDGICTRTDAPAGSAGASGSAGTAPAGQPARAPHVRFFPGIVRAVRAAVKPPGR